MSRPHGRKMPRSGYPKNFTARTQSQYASMKKRCDPPFTLEEYRAAAWDGLVVSFGRCSYCRDKITDKTFSPDHTVPLERGGSAGLENINVACCKACNTVKGRMDGEEYEAFRQFLDSISSEAASHLVAAVKTGAPLRFRFARRK